MSPPEPILRSCAPAAPAAAEGLEDGSALGVRTLLCLVVLVPVLALACVLALLLVWIAAPRAWIDRLYLWSARCCLGVAGIRVHVEGREHLGSGEPCVVVANHESDIDPVVLIAALAPMPLRAVLKQQVLRLPLLGPALIRTGNVSVSRSDTAQDVQRLRAGMAALPPGVSMLFYAEGTRSRDGAFHPFKKGAFVAAIAGGLPVLPIATAGTRRIWPPLTLRIRGGPATVEIGAPIRVTGLTLDDREHLREQAHESVRRLRCRARDRLRALGVEPGGIDDVPARE